METNDFTAGDKDNQKGNKSKSCDTKSFRIRLLGHCIFCLRKTTKNREGEVRRLPTRDSSSVIIPEHVPSAAPELSTCLLSTFNRFWPHFQSIDGVEKVDNISHSPEDEILRGRSATTFSRLPRMCQFCAEKLQSVDRFWRDLIEHVNELRATIKESHYGGMYACRAENFEKSLINSSLERDVVGTVLEFLKITNLQTERGNSVQESQNSHSPMEPTVKQQNPSSNIQIISNMSSSFTLKNQTTIKNTPPRTRKLYRQNFVKGHHAITFPSRRPLYRQSSEAYTSHENETSSADQIEADEGEQADDESGPEYLKLKPSDEDGATAFSSEEDTDYFKDYRSEVCQIYVPTKLTCMKI